MLAVTMLIAGCSAFNIYIANYMYNAKNEHRREFDIIKNNRRITGEFVSAKPSQHIKGSVCNYHYFVHQKEYFSEVVVDNKEALKDSVTLFYDPLRTWKKKRLQKKAMKLDYGSVRSEYGKC